MATKKKKKARANKKKIKKQYNSKKIKKRKNKRRRNVNRRKNNTKTIKNDTLNKDKENIRVKEKKIRKKDKKKLNKEEKVRKRFFKDSYIFNLVYMMVSLFIIEILFKAMSNFDINSYATLRILLSSFIFSLLITFLSSLTKKRWLRNTINLLVIFIYAFYAWLQVGFINYLGVYISFNTSSQLGAVTDYIGDYLMSFKLEYYLLFLPFIFAIVWYILINKKQYHKLKFNLKTLIFIPVLLISSLLYYGTIKVPFMQEKLQIKSNIKLFKNPDVPTVAVNQFGTTTFGLLDLKSYLFPAPIENSVYYLEQESENVVTNREISPILEEIAKNETNKKYMNLNNYFASQSVTDYNDYTGMFEGKNVVVILMESVNDAIINEEYFPNFYNLYSNGWHWENNYSPRNSCATGNNEFSAITGLYSIYNTCTANVYKENTYFESIFNLFNNKGYVTTSMHNFSEWYYYRSTIHANMGSGKFYGPKELDIKTPSYYGEWTSDIEFFEKAFDIVLNDESDEPWMTWLTTVSSHQPYSSASTYGDMYKDEFKELGYSTTVSRYLSKLKVLDEAIGVMVQKLTEADVMDDTVIVLLADHYPYGLNKTYLKEMLDYNLDDYEVERTPLVIYNSEMEPTTFSEYNFYVNLVPTLANLMNLEYDPRLYMGTDVLSENYESMVVFADGSWKNEFAFYNASTSKIKYYTDLEYTAEEIQQINAKVDLKISMSSSAIKSNYFDYLNKEIEKYNEEEIIINNIAFENIIKKND